ncbi:uncharacterized protein [Apostichopus japonicus]|uniref:uncharacterized protein isoform X2 n=1 Tax=Stichopus japonicus TaxID=307972 RepID=UPI003AB5F6A1
MECKTQVMQIDDAQEMLDTLQCNRSLLKRGSEFDISIVNLTTHQINKLLPFYRPFFHEPSAQNDSLQQQPARERRNSNIRICPALAQQTIPQLAFNSEGTISQIIQLNSMNVNQIFFEEECEFSTSPILPSVDCISSTRLVNAFVIDLATNTISTQYIEIQSCVSVLGPP